MGGRGRVRSAIAWLVIVAMLVPACASRSVPPMGAGGQPFRPEADERALWAKAEKEEETLLKRVKAYDDPMLEEYLGRIGDRLTPETVRQSGGVGFRFAVLRDPTLNAFAMPNGRIYVHTGLLARVENEAQLSAVLGHEMTHTINRHALSFQRDIQNKQILYTVLGIAASIGIAVAAGSRAQSGDYIGAAVLSQTANAVLGLGLQLATIAAINGYSRDLERDADAGGMEKMVAAGYDVREAPRVFEILQKEAKDGGSLETFFFGNHPKLQERIDNANELLRTTHAGVLKTQTLTRDTEDFQLRMRTVVRDNAYEELRAGRFAFAQAQLDRVLRITPKDPIAHLYYGDLYRLQAQRARGVADKDTLAWKALGEYELAARLDPKLPDPYRQLGFLYYQQKDNTRAKEAFEKYLALKPDAPDAKRVKEYVVELDR
ncbi:MAG: tetratricopeptide repeat protein [Candidatus Rokuibacteriota bacterium]